MWQLYALSSLFFSASENIVDKSALITDKRIDYAVATFWRIAMFVACAALIESTGLLGSLRYSFSPMLILFGIPCALASLGSTYLLRRVEVTSIGAVSYLAPFLFLAVDALLLHRHFSATEIAGITIATLGGFGFAFDMRTRRIKKELSLFVWGLLLFDVVQTGAEAYLFKYVNAAYGVSAVEFFLSVWLPAAVFLFGLVLLQRKSHLLLRKPALKYLPRMAVSKTFDATSSILWAQALTLAAVSQVSALQSLDPLVLFGLVVFVQQVLHIRTGERLSISYMKLKTFAVGMLIFGGWLIG